MEVEAQSVKRAAEEALVRGEGPQRTAAAGAEGIQRRARLRGAPVTAAGSADPAATPQQAPAAENGRQSFQGRLDEAQRWAWAEAQAGLEDAAAAWKEQQEQQELTQKWQEVLQQEQQEQQEVAEAAARTAAIQGRRDSMLNEERSHATGMDDLKSRYRSKKGPEDGEESSDSGRSRSSRKDRRGERSDEASVALKQAMTSAQDVTRAEAASAAMAGRAERR